MAEKDHRLARPVWRRRLAPLGVPIEFASTDLELLSAICAPYAEWEEGAPDGAAAISLWLKFGEDARDGSDLEIHVEGPKLIVSGGGVLGEADAVAKTARCRVPRGLPSGAPVLAEIADALVLFLLTRSGRTPLHAAGFLYGGTAVVLAGPSGTGKSTLALAAMRQGLEILSDDTLYIQLQPRLRVWGFRRPLHVFPKDAPRFTAGTRVRGGKLKSVVPIAFDGRERLFAEKALTILLEPGAALNLVPVDREVAMTALGRLEAGFDLLREESAAAAEAMVARGAWRLTLSRDPAAAIGFLKRQLDAGLPAR
jgi:hypothetical protein